MKSDGNTIGEGFSSWCLHVSGVNKACHRDMTKEILDDMSKRAARGEFTYGEVELGPAVQAAIKQMSVRRVVSTSVPRKDYLTELGAAAGDASFNESSLRHALKQGLTYGIGVCIAPIHAWLAPAHSTVAAQRPLYVHTEVVLLRQRERMCEMPGFVDLSLLH